MPLHGYTVIYVYQEIYHDISLWCRVEGLWRVTEVAVGEKHSIALSNWCSAPEPFVLTAQDFENISNLQRLSSEESQENDNEQQDTELGRNNITWSSPSSLAYWDAIAAGIDKEDAGDEDLAG